MVVGLCASLSIHPSAAAQSGGPDVAFYLQGTCLCDVTPTAQEALGLAGGYLESAGAINGIGYPAGLLFAADALVGSGAVNAALAQAPANSTVTLAGVSQGAIVLNYVKLARLLQDSHSRSTTDNLRFVTFGDPQNTTGGITTKIPALQLFAPNVPVPTSYRTTEIVREYDGFSDWPDKPTHLAVLNAVMGIGFVHPDYGSAANPTTPGTLTTVRTNAAGGTTTHYVVPTAGLPLTQPLRNIGLNTSLVDHWLRPQIDQAYVRRPQVEAGATAPPPAKPARDKTADAPRPGTDTSTAKPETKASAATGTTAATGAKPAGSTKDKAAKTQSDSKVRPARER